MQVASGPIQTAFPKWTASSTLVGLHGFAAYQHVQEAIHASTPTDRLDAGIAAYTSFDHALDNARELPLEWAVPDIDKYLSGYDVARQLLLQLSNADIVPGAREHVGSVTMHAGRSSFAQAVRAARTDDSRYGGFLAAGWLAAATEDAATGAQLLRTNGALGTQLLTGLAQVREAIRTRQQLDPTLVNAVSDLFAKADTQLAAQVAEAAQGTAAVDPAAASAAMRSTDSLLGGWLATHPQS